MHILSHMKEWICHDWLHRTSPERFSAGIQSGQLEHLTDFLTRESSVLGKKSKFEDHILSVWFRQEQTFKDLREKFSIENYVLKKIVSALKMNTYLLLINNNKF